MRKDDRQNRSSTERSRRARSTAPQRPRASNPGARPTDVSDELRIAYEELAHRNRRLVELQHELEQSRDRYFDLFANAPVGYMLLDGWGVIQEVNLTACRTIGADRTVLAGRPLVGMLVPADVSAFLEHMRRCRSRRGERVETDLRLNTRRGQAVWVQLSSHFSASEDLPAFPTAIIDLTERVKLEEERARAEHQRQRFETDERVARASAEAKDRFIAMLSHELRTPLTPALFAAIAMSEHRDLPPELVRLAQTIRRNIEMESRLIDDLLEVTRAARGTLPVEEARPVDLHATIREAVAFAPARSHRASCRSTWRSMPAGRGSMAIRCGCSRSSGTC